MIIGFDFDKVLVNYPPFIPDFVIDYLYKSHKNGLHYRIPTNPIEILLRKLSHFYLFRPPITANITFVHDLASSGKHQLHLISSRYNFLERITHHLLDRFRLTPDFTSVNLNLDNEQAHLFKLHVIKKLKIDIFVDDDYQLLLFLSQQKLATKLYCYRPKLDELSVPGVTVINDLRHLLA